MNTPEEDAREDFIESLYADFTDEILAGQNPDLFDGVVKQFTRDRLQMFFLRNPEIASLPLRALGEAKSLDTSHPSAALVFAVTALEVGIKSMLLKPVLHGLVHADFAGPLIAEIAAEGSHERSKRLLFAILAEYGGVDLKSYTRQGGRKTLWEEMADIQKTRNAVVHRGESAQQSDAATSIDLATEVIERLFPMLISKLGLKTLGPSLSVGR